jgi:hypothetical protein
MIPDFINTIEFDKRWKASKHIIHKMIATLEKEVTEGKACNEK